MRRTNRMQLVLQVADDCGEVHVELDSFLKFNLRMDWQIDSMVARWADDAAPCDRTAGPWDDPSPMQGRQHAGE